MKQTLLDVLIQEEGRVDRLVDVAKAHQLRLDQDLPADRKISTRQDFAYFRLEKKHVETKKTYNDYGIFNESFNPIFE